MTACACPGCAAPMERRPFARKPVGELELDFCFTCHGMWLDQFESAQLTPGAVIEVFRVIHAHDGTPGRPSRDVMPCPRCSGRLQLTHDIQRTQRIVYHRCAEGHGRFSSFLQFLREKEFVRDLTAAEVAQLRANVAQVRCSSCGAPIDLAREARCGYCRSPLSILDGAAVERTLAALTEQERRATRNDPTAVMDAMIAGQRVDRMAHATQDNSHWGLDLAAVDLVSCAIGLLLDA